MKTLRTLLLITLFVTSSCGANNGNSVLLPPDEPNVPAEILAVMSKGIYRNATWGLVVLNRDTGQTLYDFNPNQELLIGSVRKLFSVGAALDQLGESHRFVTEVHRSGAVDGNGVLNGDLVLVASGDFTMGMRRQADQTMAITRVDHNEARVVGTSILTNTDALAAYRELAQKVAASGVTQVAGEIIVDDRLFQSFDFRGEFQVTPAFVNEDFIDVSATPTAVGQAATLTSRPQSQAFSLLNQVTTVAGNGEGRLTLTPPDADCIGTLPCALTVSGELPLDGGAPFTNEYPVVQNFRVTQPSNLARTVFIEELQNAGVTIAAPVVAPNPAAQLPPASQFTPQTLVADYTSLPFSEYARLVLKVSFNLGADTTLVHFGLTQGVNSLAQALDAEQERLVSGFGLSANNFTFLDGAGGGQTSATPTTVVDFLQAVASRPIAQSFRNALPLLAVDGTLQIVDGFLADPSLAGAAGQVAAKTGTLASLTDDNQILLGARAMAGHITTRSGQELTYVVMVNNAGPFPGFFDTIEVSDDLGVISALLWRDN